MPELVDVQPGSAEWLAARRQGITATDIPAILGISPYDSAYSLYYRKRGELPELEDNDRFRLGREIESYVAQRWVESSGGGYVRAGGLYRNYDRSWQMATMDRFDGSSDVPVELKAWADADRHTWDDTPPPAVRAQLLWQMDTMSVSRGHVGVLFLPSGEFRSYTIEHAPDCYWPVVNPTSALSASCPACQDIDLMRVAGTEFYLRVHDGQPPSLDGSVMTLAAVRARLIPTPGKTAEIRPAALDRLQFHRKTIKEHEAEARKWEAEIREQAGEATVYTDDDGKIIGRRIIVNAPVKAHTRHQDYIRITNQKGTNDAD